MDLSFPQIWLVIGLLMLLVELVSVTLVFIFFAVAALITALLAYFSILGGIESQIIVFSILSIVGMVTLRGKSKQWVNQPRKGAQYSDYIGETAMVIQDISAKGEGKIFYKGTEWIALSMNQVPIDAGSKVQIKKADGIKLFVEEVA